MTHTYPEIKPADIREGDLIRWEHSDSDAACEWRQTRHGRAEHRPGTYFLMSRPTPPVELPTSPTLGRATWRDGGITGTEIAVWRHTDIDGKDGGWLRRASSAIDDRDITEFIPGIFVPTESLDALRDAHDAANRTADWRKGSGIRHDAMLTFLADVDKANS